MAYTVGIGYMLVESAKYILLMHGIYQYLTVYGRYCFDMGYVRTLRTSFFFLFE